jgi:alanine dehydrogenase
MKVGIPREIKAQEFRVGATPACARAYVAAGHAVLVEAGAGEGAGYSDAEYVAAGARVLPTATAVWSAADLIVKVKEPLASEYDHLRQGQVLFTYLHLAAVPELAEALLRARVTAVGYETVRMADGTLPLLAPMSAIAGRLAVQEGAKYLERPYGGRGVLLGGVPGVPRGKVAILGGGVVGAEAAKMAVGLGADVTILDLSAKRLAALDELFGGRVQTLYSNEENLARVLGASDLVVGAVLVPGARAPKLIQRAHLALMPKGAVLVDVAVDQGGCAETTQATTHDDPVYVVDGIVHYAVANMPGAVSRTSTQALTSVTTPYGVLLATHGFEAAARMRPELAPGLQTRGGVVTHPAVAEALGRPWPTAA